MASKKKGKTTRQTLDLASALEGVTRAFGDSLAAITVEPTKENAEYVKINLEHLFFLLGHLDMTGLPEEYRGIRWAFLSSYRTGIEMYEEK